MADSGEGPGGAGPPLFRPKWGPKGRKCFFLRPAHPLISGLDDRAPPYLRVWMTGPPYLRVWMTGPPLIWRSGSATEFCKYIQFNSWLEVFCCLETRQARSRSCWDSPWSHYQCHRSCGGSCNTPCPTPTASATRPPTSTRWYVFIIFDIINHLHFTNDVFAAVAFMVAKNRYWSAKCDVKKIRGFGLLPVKETRN